MRRRCKLPLPPRLLANAQADKRDHQHRKQQGPQLALRALCVMGDQEVNLEPLLPPDYRVNPDLGSDYMPLARLFNTGAGTFRPFNAARFLEEINRAIPGHYRQPTPATIIQTYRHHVEHGDRQYFLGWRDNDLRGDRVSPENLAKTERCFGPNIRTLCERTNQSSCWTHIAAREKAFFAPPAKR